MNTYRRLSTIVLMLLTIIILSSFTDECIQPFDQFAYQAPLHALDELYPPGPRWKYEAVIPGYRVEGYSGGWDLDVAVSRIVGKQEIWLTADLYGKNRQSQLISVYTVDTQDWRFIVGDVENTGFFVDRLFVTPDGAIWASVTSDDQQETIGSPILSKFNEYSQRFEAVEIPLDRPDSVSVRVALDQTGNFWIFATNDGIYRFDPVRELTEKYVDLPDWSVRNIAPAPDGSLYFDVYSDQPYRRYTYYRTAPGTLFQFIPDTKEIVNISLPEPAWPFYSGLLVDHSGRLWVGANGYRDIDGNWILIHADPEAFLEVVDSGSYSYVWNPPWIMLESSDGRLWFNKALDTSGQMDGIGWYDPNTASGCMVTNIPAQIIEDTSQQLWMVSDGVLYSSHP